MIKIIPTTLNCRSTGGLRFHHRNKWYFQLRTPAPAPGARFSFARQAVRLALHEFRRRAVGPARLPAATLELGVGAGDESAGRW